MQETIQQDADLDETIADKKSMPFWLAKKEDISMIELSKLEI